MSDFAVFRPHTVEEAVALLAQYGEEARPLAGGTALALLVKQRLVHPTALISLAAIPELRGVRREADGLHLGAMTPHAEVERLDGAAGVPPLLVETYRRVATRRIRNQATVGGGLAHGDPAQDPPAALLALDALVRLVGPAGERVLPVEAFFVDYYQTALQPGELLTEVIIPPQPERAAGVYLKFLPRTVDDYATVAVAVRLSLAGRELTDVRIAFVAAGPTPIRARAIEAMLDGEVPRPGLLREAGERAKTIVDPLDDVRGSAAYKREMAAVFLRRALESAVERARAGR
ncbi:MAG: xanthine dehydrogenase family protein subunit M [Chloroflexota bacterium]|nr:xanthine dehydrogenase family protein subunit M [Dehalococcoidia bacterium]MDW8254424.1 xanthine dehydrogenase family protein subunit M [Chloroflexota bacterium]